MIDIKAEEAAGSQDDVYPNPAIVIGGAGVVGLISTLSLPWPVAVASTVLGTLMIAGAEVDARTFLLPDPVTLGAVICGILAAPLLNTTEPWTAVAETIARRLRRRLRLAQANRGPGPGRHQVRGRDRSVASA